MTTELDAHDEAVKRMALKLYREEGIRPECERCFIVTDPTCPDFPHVCALETGLEGPGPSRDWILENLPSCIKMRKRHMSRTPIHIKEIEPFWKVVAAAFGFFLFVWLLAGLWRLLTR